MNIVLATSPAEDDRHGVRSLPPLSLGYLAATLKQLPGVTVRIVDAYGEDLNTDAATARILALQPDVLGVSSTSFCFQAGLRLVNSIKAQKRDTLTMMGGYHPTMFDDLMLKEAPQLDLILRGEADHSLPELCSRLMRGQSTDGTPGLSYRSNGHVVRGVPQQIDDLDSLPFPDRNAMDFAGYFYQFGGFYLPDIPLAANVVSSRSCPFKCTFCPKLFPEWRYRIRSAENVFQELLELSSRGVEIAFFQDENFSHNVRRVEKLCRMIIDHRLNMRFAFQGTIHHLPDSVFQLMQEAGFDALFVGVESGSNDQLKRYRKPSRNENLAISIRRAKAAHMAVIAFFIHGGPGETAADAQATQQFIREVQPHVCGASELSVQPGTVLWDELAGTAPPSNLEASCPRRIHEFSGQHTAQDIRERRKGFQQAFRQSWMSGSRIGDAFSLLRHNRTLQRIAKDMLLNPKSFLQLIRGGPREKDDARLPISRHNS